PWAFAFGFAPRRYRRRTRRREPALDTGRGLATTTPERLRVAPSQSPSVIPSLLSPQGVQGPAAADVDASLLTAVGENLFVVAPRLLERVSEHTHPFWRKSPLLVNRPGQLHDGAIIPLEQERGDGHRAER